MGLLKRFVRSFLRKGKKKSKDNTLGRVPSTSSIYSWPVPRQPQVTNLDTPEIDDVAETTKQLRRNTSPSTPTHPAVSHPHRPLSVERVIKPPSTQYSTVMDELPLDSSNSGSRRRLPPTLNLGGSRKYNNRPSYNVTVHRKKLHAVTELDNQGFSDDFSSESGSSSPSRHESPSPHRHRRSSTDDRGMLRALREDSSVFNILKLYDDDGAVPPAVFSNSPLRPEFEIPEEERPPKSVSTPYDPGQDSSLTSPGTTTKDENGDTSSTSISPSEYHASVAPLNVPSSSDPFKCAPPTSSLHPSVSTQHLRLSSPLLIDFLFSPEPVFSSPQPNSLPQSWISPDDTHDTSPWTRSIGAPSIIIQCATPESTLRMANEVGIAFPSSTTNRKEELNENDQSPSLLGPGKGIQVSTEDQSNDTHSLESDFNIPVGSSEDEDKENRPPVSDTLASLEDLSPDAQQVRSRDSAFYSLYSSPRHSPESYKSYSPSEMERIENASPSSTSRIIEHYVLPAADVEEDHAATETAIITAWTTTGIISTDSSPQDTLSPPSPLEPQTPSLFQFLPTLRSSPGSLSMREHRMSHAGVAHFSARKRELSWSSHEEDPLVHGGLSDPLPRPRRLVTSYPLPASTPHRGMIGIDRGGNREAFLYGQEDDETFTRKLNSHLALFRPRFDADDALDNDVFLESSPWFNPSRNGSNIALGLGLELGPGAPLLIYESPPSFSGASFQSTIDGEPPEIPALLTYRSHEPADPSAPENTTRTTTSPISSTASSPARVPYVPLHQSPTLPLAATDGPSRNKSIASSDPRDKSFGTSKIPRLRASPKGSVNKFEAGVQTSPPRPASTRGRVSSTGKGSATPFRRNLTTDGPSPQIPRSAGGRSHRLPARSSTLKPRDSMSFGWDVRSRWGG